MRQMQRSEQLTSMIMAMYLRLRVKELCAVQAMRLTNLRFCQVFWHRCAMCSTDCNIC